MQPSLKLIETGTERRGKKEGPYGERGRQPQSVAGPVGDPEKQHGRKENRDPRACPRSRRSPRASRNGLVRAHVVFVEIIMPQLHTKCKWFSFAFVESRYAVATRTEASTAYRRENGKRPTTPSCRRPFRRDPGKQQAQEIRRPQDCFPVSPGRSAGVDPIDSFV